MERVTGLCRRRRGRLGARRRGFRRARRAWRRARRRGPRPLRGPEGPPRSGRRRDLEGTSRHRSQSSSQVAPAARARANSMASWPRARATPSDGRDGSGAGEDPLPCLGPERRREDRLGPVDLPGPRRRAQELVHTLGQLQSPGARSDNTPPSEQFQSLDRARFLGQPPQLGGAPLWGYRPQVRGPQQLRGPPPPTRNRSRPRTAPPGSPASGRRRRSRHGAPAAAPLRSACPS